MNALGKDHIDGIRNYLWLQISIEGLRTYQGLYCHCELTASPHMGRASLSSLWFVSVFLIGPLPKAHWAVPADNSHCQTRNIVQLAS